MILTQMGNRPVRRRRQQRMFGRFDNKCRGISRQAPQSTEMC